jgi:hypothetical protein
MKLRQDAQAFFAAGGIAYRSLQAVEKFPTPCRRFRAKFVDELGHLGSGFEIFIEWNDSH